MKSLEDSRKLAQAMVRIGAETGRKTMAVISDMSQPLGFAIGNALEVKEAIETLKGKGPQDLTELCLTLGSQMVYLAQKATSLTRGTSNARKSTARWFGTGKIKDFYTIPRWRCLGR